MIDSDFYECHMVVTQRKNFLKKMNQHFENIDGCEIDNDDFLILGISEEHDMILIQML